MGENIYNRFLESHRTTEELSDVIRSTVLEVVGVHCQVSVTGSSVVLTIWEAFPAPRREPVLQRLADLGVPRNAVQFNVMVRSPEEEADALAQLTEKDRRRIDKLTEMYQRERPRLSMRPPLRYIGEGAPGVAHPYVVLGDPRPPPGVVLRAIAMTKDDRRNAMVCEVLNGALLGPMPRVMAVNTIAGYVEITSKATGELMRFQGTFEVYDARTGRAWGLDGQPHGGPSLVGAEAAQFALLTESIQNMVADVKGEIPGGIPVEEEASQEHGVHTRIPDLVVPGCTRQPQCSPYMKQAWAHSPSCPVSRAEARAMAVATADGPLAIEQHAPVLAAALAWWHDRFPAAMPEKWPTHAAVVDACPACGEPLSGMTTHRCPKP